MWTSKRFVVGLTMIFFSIFMPAQRTEAQPEAKGSVKDGVRNIVLVHGAFADGSSWTRILPLLYAKGYNVIAVQNPLTSLEDDVAATKRAIAAMDGPVILVGHSYGGMVITEAGNDPRVAGLLYVCALIPDDGQSVGDVVKPFPPAPGSAEFQQDASGYLTLSNKGIHTDFAQDLPAQTRQIIYTTQVPWAVKATMGKISNAAWKTKQSWCIIGTEDQMVPVALARAEAKMIGARVLELKSSHVPMISQPEKVASFIINFSSYVKSH